MAYGDAPHPRMPAGGRRTVPREAGDPRRAPGRPGGRPSAQQPYDDQHRPARGGAGPHGRPQPAGGRSPAPPQGGSRLRGVLAVLGVFLVTLAGAAVDSLLLAPGLGLLTLGCLVGATVLAAALVRRRDLLSVVVAPPLVFLAAACTTVAMSSTTTLNLPTLATALVRGFPAMALATGAAVVVALIRWAAGR